MRIRSIRPEFWSSEDIAAMDWNTRLIYIGLWSYVDDNGVGRDVEQLIVADLFPLDDSLSEASLRVHGALKYLFEHGHILRYRVENKPYLFVVAFSTHQKINRPSEGRYPLPTRADAETHGALTEPSLSPHVNAPLGEGEKGRRGEGDSDYVGAARATPPASVELDIAQPETSQTLMAEWLEHTSPRPPKNVVGQVAAQLKKLLDEGQPYADVRNGLIAWVQKGIHPATLPSVVHEVRTRQQQPRRTNSGVDWDAAMQWAIEFDRSAS